MSDIYQRIWDADQAGAGVQPVVVGGAKDAAKGFVEVAAKVPSTGAVGDHKVLHAVEIPAAKKRSYDLVRELFDNYSLSEADPEVETPQERDEVHALLDAIIDSPPMQVARDYVRDAANQAISRDRWYAILLEHWFRRFKSSGDPDLSGFEHVFVGEQEGAKVQGYHFWYKYWLDDGLAGQIDRNRFPGFKDDRIVYVRGEYDDGQENFPESVTISYKWDAPDYDRNALRPLTKPKGGFFVGCSVEGLMAMGSVRAHLAALAPKDAVINGARYELKMFRSPDDAHIRTFYPVFKGVAGPRPVVEPPPAPGGGPIIGPIVGGDLRIVSALVNPVGDDPGHERISFVNVGSGAVDLEGHFLLDKMRNRFTIPAGLLAPGATLTVELPRNSVQLSNKGGEIRLLDRAGNTIHVVHYTKAQAQEEGRTILF